jgi:hypothetical protein
LRATPLQLFRQVVIERESTDPLDGKPVLQIRIHADLFEVKFDAVRRIGPVPAGSQVTILVAPDGRTIPDRPVLDYGVALVTATKRGDSSSN